MTSMTLNPELEEEPSVGEIETVEIQLKAIADAPMLKRRKFKLNSKTSIAEVLQRIRRMLKLDSQDEQLFIIINQKFAPSLDQSIENLYRCYQVDGILTLCYSKTQTLG